MPTATLSWSERMYSMPEPVPASRKPCSTVPGLPNIYMIPSAASCSKRATLPVLPGMTFPYSESDCHRTVLPAESTQVVFEDLHQQLAGKDRVGGGARGDERIVDD